jgi:hypothetical protein
MSRYVLSSVVLGHAPATGPRPPTATHCRTQCMSVFVAKILFFHRSSTVHFFCTVQESAPLMHKIQYGAGVRTIDA